MSETDLDAWMSWYTAETAHGEVKKIIAQTEATRNSATEMASHLAVQQQQYANVEMPKPAGRIAGNTASRFATSWYDDIDEDQNVFSDHKTTTDDNIGTSLQFNIENQKASSTSWVTDKARTSSIECHTSSCEEREEDNEKRLTSWYEDETAPSSESTDQIYQQTIQSQSSGA